MPGEPRPGDPRRADEPGLGASRRPRTPRRTRAPSSGSKPASHQMSIMRRIPFRRSARGSIRPTSPVAEQDRQHVVAPASASRPGRRPPRRSRSRTASGAGRGPRRTGRAARGTRRHGRSGRRPPARTRPPRAAAGRRATMYRSPLTPSTVTGTSSPASTSSARISLPRRHARPPGLVADPGVVPIQSSPEPDPRAGRSRGSATGACGGTGRAAAGARRAGPAGTAARPGRRRGGCPRAARCPRMPGLGQRLEDRPDLVGRAPVPVDRRARLDVGRRQRTVAPDPIEELRDEVGVLDERAASCRARLRSQLTRYHGSSAVGRIDRPLLYASNRTRSPYSSASVQARRKPSIRAARSRSWFRPDDVERVELERAEPVHHAHDRRGLGGRDRGGASRWRRAMNRRAVARSRCRGGVTGRWYGTGRTVGARTSPARSRYDAVTPNHTETPNISRHVNEPTSVAPGRRWSSGRWSRTNG